MQKSSFYRIVVADSRSPRDGRFIEEIGYYNPMEEPKVVKKVDADKAKRLDFQRCSTYRYCKKLYSKTWCSVIIGRITHEGIIVNSCKKGLVEFPDQVTRGSR